MEFVLNGRPTEVRFRSSVCCKIDRMCYKICPTIINGDKNFLPLKCKFRWRCRKGIFCLFCLLGPKPWCPEYKDVPSFFDLRLFFWGSLSGVSRKRVRQERLVYMSELRDVRIERKRLVCHSPFGDHCIVV